MSVLLLFVLMSWISVMPCPTQAHDGGRELYFPAYYFFAWKRLVNHTIISGPVKDLDECEYRCYLNANCVSLNIRDHHNGTHECELNNSTHLEHDGHLKDRKLYYYRGAENKCGKNGSKCKNNSTCQSGFTQKGYRCFCAAGFEGEHCENDIDDCISHPCKNNGTCTDRVNGFNCSCAPGFNGTQCERDIDECTAQVNPCDDANNFECKNTRGSYNCQCKDGFVKNGDDCEVVCPQYKNLTDADRKYGPDTTGSPKCDDQLHGWYRFHGDAGRKMMTTCPSVNKCGGSLSAWLNGDHPTVAQGSVKKKVCFRMAEPGDCCVESYFTDVKNCGSYFIYKLLPNPVTCYYRYCGTD